MTAEHLRERGWAFDPEVPIERAWTPPASWYVDPAFHEFERRTVFARSWQPVVRADQLAAPGSYAAGCFAGEPWVVVRDHDTTIRAFHNVCRHKGREVVTGSGLAERLVCGYHGWSYGLDGRLATAPQMAGIEDFDRDTMSLVPLRAETWGPWVFVNRDPEAANLAERWRPLEARLGDRGWEGLRHVGGKAWTLECNWKVYADNYLDGGYHIPHTHPTLDAQLDMDSYRTELGDGFSIQMSRAATSADDRIDYHAAERIGAEAVYAWTYPNFMINRYGPCLDSNWIVPLGPNRCQVVYEFFLDEDGPAGAERFLSESIAQSDVTQREDIEICESVQVGLRSTAYDRGRYAPRLEIGEHHFHGLLARDYRRAFTD